MPLEDDELEELLEDEVLEVELEEELVELLDELLLEVELLDEELELELLEELDPFGSSSPPQAINADDTKITDNILYIAILRIFLVLDLNFL